MCSSEPGTWPGGPRAQGEITDIPCPDGTRLPIYTCTPTATPGPWPTVVVIHDYYDPEHFYHELACRYAGEGYRAVCPSLFHREGPLSEQVPAVAGKRISAVADDTTLADLDAVLSHLEKEVPSTGLAVTGFCWGGRMAYLLAARHPEVQLLLPFYGHVVAFSGPDGSKPSAPLEEANRIRARVEGFYGEQDGSISVEDVREMERRLRAAGGVANLRVIPGVGHSFFREDEHRAASDTAWREVLAALAETFKA